MPASHIEKGAQRAARKERDIQKKAEAAEARSFKPEEIAPAFVFLASPQTSSYITGEVLPIVGGY